jgi:hypothetical protein
MQEKASRNTGCNCKPINARKLAGTWERCQGLFLLRDFQHLAWFFLQRLILSNYCTCIAVTVHVSGRVLAVASMERDNCIQHTIPVLRRRDETETLLWHTFIHEVIIHSLLVWGWWTEATRPANNPACIVVCSREGKQRTDQGWTRMYTCFLTAIVLLFTSEWSAV